MKDDQPTVGTYVVTAKKKMIKCAPATVVVNTLRTGTHEIEGTEDWYAQDVLDACGLSGADRHDEPEPLC